MTAKTQYVRAHNLRGIMFWELAHDPTGELLRAISAAAARPKN
jgi:GH18 family chitinase